MDYFSAHSDKNELLEYLSFNSPERLKKIFLVHGEPDQSEPFMEEVKKKLDKILDETDVIAGV